MYCSNPILERARTVIHPVTAKQHFSLPAFRLPRIYHKTFDLTERSCGPRQSNLLVADARFYSDIKQGEKYETALQEHHTRSSPAVYRSR